MRFYLAHAGVIGTLWLCSGCVLYETRDQIKEANASLSQVSQKLDQLQVTNKELVAMRGQMDTIQELLKSVDRNLSETNKSLSSVDRSLASVDQSLASANKVLSSTQVMLGRVNQDMAGMLETIRKISDAIPFLDISPESPKTQPSGAGGK